MRKSKRSAGYSLVELLVVVGIIGIIAAFAAPAFMNFQRSLKIKSSLRQLTTDIRSARQVAVTQRAPMKITFSTDPAENRRQYEILMWDRVNSVWEAYPEGAEPRQLEELVYFFSDDTHKTFPNTKFPTGATAEADDRPDIVFEPNGTIRMEEVAAAPASFEPGIWIRCDDNIPFNQMHITLAATGSVQTEQNKWN